MEKPLVWSSLSRALKGPSLKSSNSGQAVIEYLLVLIVMVGIIIGVLYQLNDAFKKYVANYFGNYVACLLETGEMPSLGGEDGSGGECNSQFEQFNIADGRPSKASSGGRRGAGSGARSSSRRVSNSRAGNSRVSKSRNSTFIGERGGGGDGSGSSSKKSIKGKKGSSDSSYSIGYGDGDVYRARRLRGRFQRSLAKHIDKKEKEKINEKKSIRSGDTRQRKAKMPFDPAVLKNRAPTSSVDVSFTFGDYLRYMIIGAIIIAMVFFVGGQLNTIRKSWEKGE